MQQPIGAGAARPRASSRRSWTSSQAMRARAAGRPEACDFTFGNPHEMPLPGLVAALRRSVEPRREDWFAYKTSEAEPREVVAAALGARARPRASSPRTSR